MSKQLDFLAIGDITTDAFIRIKDAKVNCDINHQNCQLCMRFGDKIPYEFVEVVKGVGNSANAAVSAARLGLHSGLIADVGDDQNGKEMIGSLDKNGVSIDHVRIHKGLESNYHYVLWYESERTILVKHHEFPYKMPEITPAPKWIYLSSLAETSLEYHKEIESYLKRHPEVNLAFQPGTFQMKLGVEGLKGLYKRSKIFVCNVEEAQRILKITDRDVKKLLAAMHELGPEIVAITDGFDGAYVSDGTNVWFMGVYPHVPIEKTGAGDAFASTFVSALILGKTIEEAIQWAPLNSQSVVQQIGAQKGLLTQAEIEVLLKNAPEDYKPRKI